MPFEEVETITRNNAPPTAKVSWFENAGVDQ